MPGRMQYAIFAFATLLVAGSAVAGQVVGETVLVREPVGEDLYLAGRTVDVLADVKGDITAGGRNVLLARRVAGDVAAAGETVTVGGEVGDDVRVIGRSVSLTGPVAGHVVAFGATVSISGEGTVGDWAWLAGEEIRIDGGVGREVRAWGQHVVVGGRVGGDAEIRAERVTVLPTARIEGDLVVRMRGEPEIRDGAHIAGEVIVSQLEAPGAAEGAGVGASLVGALVIMATAIVAYLAFPGLWTGAAERARARPLLGLALGLAVLVATPVAALLLMVTTLGVLLGLVVLAAWLILLLGGWLAALYTMGDAGLRLSGRAEGASHGLRVVSIVLAVVLVTLLGWVPYLGGLALVLLFLLGLGALSMRLWRAYPGMAGSRA